MASKEAAVSALKKYAKVNETVHKSLFVFFLWFAGFAGLSSLNVCLYSTIDRNRILTQIGKNFH